MSSPENRPPQEWPSFAPPQAAQAADIGAPPAVTAPALSLPTPPAAAASYDFPPPTAAQAALPPTAAASTPAVAPAPAEDELRALPPLTRQAPPPAAYLAEAELPVLNEDLHYCLEAVIQYGASDLHITVGSPPMIRLDGGLRPVPGQDRWLKDKVALALQSVLKPDQRFRYERDLELDLAYSLPGRGRFRVNLYQQRESMGAAFRLIPTDIKPLAELGVPSVVNRLAALPRGLVLVTGPTGSGKSTTLAGLIDLANSTRADHIMTVEDPIEFLHRHKKSLVNQREVGADTHSFANALKHVLRQDPDIILVGEMRDLETISVALTAAETGHLVFATLHTQSAPATIDRIIDVFPPEQQDQIRVQLSVTLQGVVCQTLVKRAGGKGRAVATEVMFTTPAIANLIREGKTYQVASAMQSGREMGMHTMDQHLAELVTNGTVTYEAAKEKAQDIDGFDRLVQAGNARNSNANLAASGPSPETMGR